MKISKIICFLSVSGFNCCPIAKEILMRKQSENGKNIQRRSTDEQKCREYVVVNCRVLTRDFNAKYRLEQYEICVSDGSKKKCGSKIRLSHNPWFLKYKIFLETKSRRLNPTKTIISTKNTTKSTMINTFFTVRLILSVKICLY